MDIHPVRDPQDVDVVNQMSGESQRNEENIPHFVRFMLTAMILRKSNLEMPYACFYLVVGLCVY